MSNKTNIRHITFKSEDLVTIHANAETLGMTDAAYIRSIVLQALKVKSNADAVTA